MGKQKKNSGAAGNKPYVSLAVRIPTIVAGAVLIVITIICIAFGIMTFRNINNMAQNQIKNVARQNALTVQKYMNGMNIYADALGSSILNYRLLGREDGETAIVSALTQAVESGKIFSAYFAFEPNGLFEGTPNGLSYYVYPTGSSGTATDILNDYADYSNADYYAPTKTKLMTHITAPYTYELSDGTTVYLITLSTPILDNGKFIGVANCDMLTDTLGDLSYSDGDYDSAYLTLTDSGNMFIANTGKPELVGETENYDADVTSQVFAGDTLLRTVKDRLNGDDSFCVYVPILLEGSDLQWMLSNIVHKEEVYGPIYSSLIIVAIIGVIGIALLAVIAAGILRKSLSPINHLMKMAEDVGSFNLHSNDDFSYPNDELGALASIFMKMARNLQEIITDVSHMLADMADGDFTTASSCPDRYIGDMRSTLESINQIKSTLGKSLKEINESATKVAQNSSQISDGAQALAQGATEQAGSVQELSATINTVNEDVKSNATNAERASDIALRTKDAIVVSNEEMHKLTDSMDAIEEASNKIQDVISIIDNIAFQTNILSLNAAIEAARAGQAGKGFAVVADEVGNLAKRSQEAAQSTSDLIQMVTDAVNKGKAITDDTAEALMKVSGFADDTNNMIKEISEASTKQADALEQISIGINQISEVVQNNSSTSEESAAASIELANEANRLHDLVAPFKLP